MNTIRTVSILVAALAACNHDSPRTEEGSGSAPVSTTAEPIPAPDVTAEAPPSKRLPGAGLPGGVRGEPKSGRATLADIGVEATWPDDLRARWLSTDALLVTLDRRPVMLAKLAAASPDVTEGVLTKTPAGDKVNASCERTLRGQAYRIEASNVDDGVAASIGKLCQALK